MNAETVAGFIVGVVQVYILLGLVFAAPFVLFVAKRIDPAAKSSTWGFRVLVIPGVALLWPLLLKRVLMGQQKPLERNAHRHCALRPSDSQKVKVEPK